MSIEIHLPTREDINSNEMENLMTGQRTEICLVDDEPEISASFSFVLKDDYKVTSFTSAAAALHAFDEGYEPSAILTDLRMPEMDGFEFVRSLKAAKAKNRIIMMSGHADKRDILQALTEGVHGFLEKPFSMTQLLDTVAHVLASDGGGEPAPSNIYAAQDKIIFLLEELNQIYFGRIAQAENTVFELDASRKLTPISTKKLIDAVKRERLITDEVSQLKKVIGSYEFKRLERR